MLDDWHYHTDTEDQPYEHMWNINVQERKGQLNE